MNNRDSHSLLVGIQNCLATLEDTLAVSYKVNTILSCEPASMFLGIYPIDLQSEVHTKACM